MSPHVRDDPERYARDPPYVVTPEQERRWNLCEDMSKALFADLDPEERREQVWSATRALYQSEIPRG